MELLSDFLIYWVIYITNIANMSYFIYYFHAILRSSVTRKSAVAVSVECLICQRNRANKMKPR